jgi:hypothetical protein
LLAHGGPFCFCHGPKTLAALLLQQPECHRYITSSDNFVRRNIIMGNPAAQVIKTFVVANQQGADIAFRPNFTGANNTIEDNFCLTYIQGAGPATAPPNIRTEGVEDSASRLTSAPNRDKGSNGPRTARSSFQMAFAIASFLAAALGLGLLCIRVTV